METLITKFSNFNNKMHDALEEAQRDTLLDMQARTYYQIVLTTIEFEDSKCDLLRGIAGPSQRSLIQPLGTLAQQKFIHLTIENPQYVS